MPWQTLTPDPSGDWLNQGDEAFQAFAPLGAKKDTTAEPMFGLYSLGVVTNRDAWAYNFSRPNLLATITRMADFYNAQVEDFRRWIQAHKAQRTPQAVEEFIDRDPHKISWTRSLKNDLRQLKRVEVDAERAVPSMYRPFCKQWLYFDRQLNEMVLQLPKLFPTPSTTTW